MLKSLLMILICLPFVLIGRYIYMKSEKYKEDLKDEELKKQSDIESQKLENFINLLEKEDGESSSK